MKFARYIIIFSIVLLSINVYSQLSTNRNVIQRVQKDFNQSFIPFINQKSDNEWNRKLSNVSSTILMQDDFDDPNNTGNWLVAYPNGHGCSYGFGYRDADSIAGVKDIDYFSGNTIYASSYQGSPCRFDGFIFSKKVAFSNFDSVKISFDFAFAPWQADSLVIFADLDGVYDTLLFADGKDVNSFPQATTWWSQPYSKSIPNPKEGNDSINLVFRYSGYDGNFFVFDNVKIEGKNHSNASPGSNSEFILIDPYGEDDTQYTEYELSSSTITATECNGIVSGLRNSLFLIEPSSWNKVIDLDVFCIGKAGYEIEIYKGDYRTNNKEEVFSMTFSSNTSTKRRRYLTVDSEIISLVVKVTTSNFNDQDTFRLKWDCQPKMSSDYADPYQMEDYTYEDSDMWFYDARFDHVIGRPKELYLMPDTITIGVEEDYSPVKVYTLKNSVSSIFQVIDPSSDFTKFTDHNSNSYLSEEIKNFDHMLIDSVKLYIDHRMSNRVTDYDIDDTLRVYILDTNGLDFNNLEIEFNESKLISKNYLRVYDYLLNPRTSSWRHEFEYDHVFGLIDVDNMDPISVPIGDYHIKRGQKLVVGVSFIPGDSYSVNDTIYNETFQSYQRSDVSSFKTLTFSEQENDNNYLNGLESESVTLNTSGFIDKLYWNNENSNEYLISTNYDDYYSDRNTKEHLLIGHSVKSYTYSYFDVVENSNSEYTFTPNVSFETTSFDWDFGDNSTSSSSSATTHEFVGNGEFNVCMTSNGANGQAVTNCKTIKVDGLITEVSEFSVKSLSIYPIPASEYLIVEFEGNIDAFRILNSLGQIVSEDYSTREKGRLEIDVKKLDEGVYFIELVTPDHEILTETFNIIR